MDDIFEMFVEIIANALDVSFDSGNHRKRRKLLIITASIGIPLLILLVIVGIVDRETDLILWAVLLFVLLLLWLIRKIWEYRKGR